MSEYVTEAPDFLEGVALEEWKRILPEVEPLKEKYIMPLAVYCQAVAHYQEAQEQINAEGITIDGTRGSSTVKHPAFTVLKDAADRIKEGAMMFGFSPLYEAKINQRAVDQREDEDLEDWEKEL